MNSKTEYVIDNYRPDQKRDEKGQWVKDDAKSNYFVKWEDAPKIKLEKNELFAFKEDLTLLRDKAKEYFQINLQGNSIYKEGLGNIRISGKSLDEYFHYSSDVDKLLAVPMLPKLIEEGKLGEFETSHKERKDNIVGFYPIYANLQTPSSTRKAELIVAKDKDGNLFYQIFLDFDRDKAREKTLKKGENSGDKVRLSPNNIITNTEGNFNPMEIEIENETSQQDIMSDENVFIACLVAACKEVLGE